MQNQALVSAQVPAVRPDLKAVAAARSTELIEESDGAARRQLVAGHPVCYADDRFASLAVHGWPDSCRELVDAVAEGDIRVVRAL